MISPTAIRLREVSTQHDNKTKPIGYRLNSWPTYLSPGLLRNPDEFLAGLQPYQRSVIGGLASEMGIDAVKAKPQEVALDGYCWADTPEAMVIHSLPPDELALAQKFASFAIGESEPKTLTSRIIGMVATANAPTPAETIGFASQVGRYLEDVASKLAKPRFVVPNIDQNFSREFATRCNLAVPDGGRGLILNPAVITEALINEPSVADRDGVDHAEFEELISALCGTYVSMLEVSQARENSDPSEYGAIQLEFQLRLILLEQFKRGVMARSARS